MALTKQLFPVVLGPLDQKSLARRLGAHTQPEPNSGCLLWLAATNQYGYGVMGRGARGAGNIGAHRAAWTIAHGAIPDGMCVLHKCDTPACVNVEHLFLGTRLDNNRDMLLKHRNKIGERHGNAKLTDAQADEIRKLYAAGGVTYKELGGQFGVTGDNISCIVRYISRRGRHAA